MSVSVNVTFNHLNVG